MFRHYKQKIGSSWKSLGPGLITGAADDDPSGVATYSQTGANFGNSFLWMSLFTFPFMGVIQEMCARLGLVSGRGLAGNIKKHYSNKSLMFATFLLLFANTLNIGANLGAMAESTRLIFPEFNFLLLVIFFGGITILLEIFTTYEQYSRYLKYLSLVLFSYILVAFYVNIDWVSALRDTFIPHILINKDSIFMICAVLGTTISPYLFFWQTSQEVEEEIMKGKRTLEERVRNTSKEEISSMRKDVWFGMFVSNLAMFFIILVCSATLFKNGITNIQSASDAAQALRPLAGDYAYLIFALGIVGVGMLSIPVLAGSSAYAMAESFNWKHGLYRKFKEASAFYGVIIFSIFLGIVLNVLGVNVIQSLIYSAVLNGMIAPLIIYYIVRLCSDRKVMGKYVNGIVYKAIGWLVILLLSCAGIAALVSMI